MKEVAMAELDSIMDLSDAEILSMEVSIENDVSSLYRIRIGSDVKYLEVAASTYDEAPYFGPDLWRELPDLPLGSWITAHISRQAGKLRYELSHAPLSDSVVPWHSSRVDVLSLPKVKSQHLGSPRISLVSYLGQEVIAKIARFDFEHDWMEKETKVYQMIDGHDIGPKFLAHLVEKGRIIGFLIEKLSHSRVAGTEDLDGCVELVHRLHSLGIIHGDLNRHNFIVNEMDTLHLIDFENATIGEGQDEKDREVSGLNDELCEDTGRGQHSGLNPIMD